MSNYLSEHRRMSCKERQEKILVMENFMHGLDDDDGNAITRNQLRIKKFTLIERVSR